MRERETVKLRRLSGHQAASDGCPIFHQPPWRTNRPGNDAEWQTTERLLDSGAFEPIQRTLVLQAPVEGSETGGRWLGIAYWQAVSGFSRGTVRPRWTATGGRLTLLGGVSLLRFGPPELSLSDVVVSCRSRSSVDVSSGHTASMGGVPV